MPERKFDDETLHKMRLALVMHMGSPTQARDWLKEEQGIAVTMAYLSALKAKPEYKELEIKYGREQEEAMISVLRDNALQAAMTVRRLIDLQNTRIDQHRETDPARAAANLSKVQKDNVDKMLALTGRPSQITQSSELGSIIKGLMSRGFLKVTDDQGKELPMGEVVEGSTAD